MLRCLIAITALVSAAAVAAPAWTWVDEQGRRHFSDRPVDGATRIELSGGQTFSGAEAFSAQPSPSRQPSPQQSDRQPSVTEYAVVTVTSPENQETVFNIEGNLEMELLLFPELQPGHQIDVILDGELVAIGARSPRFTVPEVWRGEHTLQAVVSDQEGKELKQSMPVTFVVRQTSALQPRPQSVPPRANPALGNN